MAEIINLRLARKARLRAAAQETAAENRARSGRTKAQKQAESRSTAQLARTLDGARRGEDEA
jgi:hypothetical protein